MKQKLSKSKIFSIGWDYLILSLGTLIYAMGWTFFLIPNGITSGGLTGLCTTIQFGTNGAIPIGLSFPILNTILLVIAFIILGKSFGFKTIYVIALSSLFFEILPNYPFLEVLMEEKFLTALVGGSLEAIGIGMVILKGGSTGGTDILVMIVNKYWPVSPGKVYLYSDIVIISSLLLVPGMGLVNLIYACVVMLTFSVIIDYVLLGNKTSVQVLVFSKKYEEIANHVVNDIQRGVTAIYSMGWYSQQDSKVLLIILRKNQMNEVISNIKKIDKQAFVSVTPAHGVYGEGFEEIKTGIKLTKNKVGKSEKTNDEKISYT